ncbi:MAG: RNA polymerase sigma factor [Pyrinomonadaceae bacterium]|nr:RNA polymerase sigma factor [Pyrinomonadaceae bacterium]
MSDIEPPRQSKDYRPRTVHRSALRMIPHTDANDTELLQRMLAGDEEALTTLYRRRQGGIYRFVMQMCGSRVLAEDVTQEVFIVLIRDAQTFDPARGSLNSFLVGVARNLLLQRLRRERFYAPLEEDEAEQTPIYNSANVEPLEDLSRTEAIASLRAAVSALPTRYREVVVLCDLQEISYVEAAEVLGCAVGTVRSRLHRGRALLIEKLRPARKEQATSAAAKSTRCFA